MYNAVNTAYSVLIRRTLDVGGCRASVVSVTPLKGFDNEVFLVETSEEANRRSVVRLSRPGEKAFPEVRAELEFINVLASAGVKVAKALGEPADLGRSVGAWLEFVAGRQALTARELSSQVTYELGRVMGQMHTAAERVPSSTASARPAWWETQCFRLDYLSGVALPEVLADIQQYIEEVRQLSSGELLVHGDLGPRNVIIGSELHVIDFDDSCRAEPEFDLAVLLVRLFTNGNAVATDVDRTVPLLISGYRSVRSQRLNIGQLDHYARLILLQGAIAACRRPGCPGLTAPQALAQAWTAIGGVRRMPEMLQRAVERAAKELA